MWFRTSVKRVEDGSGGFGPDKESGPLVGLDDVAFDGRLQVYECGEGPASQPAACEG